MNMQEMQMALDSVFKWFQALDKTTRENNEMLKEILEKEAAKNETKTKKKGSTVEK